MRVLVFTHMYPTAAHPAHGVFVEQQVQSLRREGIDIDLCHADVKGRKWLYPWSFVPFLQRALTQRYDLVHAHYVFAGLVARSQFRYPLVVTHHGDEALGGWQVPLCRLVSRLAERTIVVTKQIKRALKLEKASVIPCGVDLDVFKPEPKAWARQQLGLPEGRKLALFVGRQEAVGKRLGLAQAAVGLLQRQGHDAELIVLSGQPYDRVPRYMNACDALVFPSAREGSPQAVKEAMACNLPVVSTDVGDVQEILAGVDGCYVCQPDPADLASKLALAFDRRDRTGGRLRAERYDLQATARKIIRVYEEALQGR